MDFLSGLSYTMEEAAQGRTAEHFSRLGAELAKARGIARESFQSLTAPDLKAVIKKLTKDEDLSQEDKDLVRLWIVGDAESYVRMENDFQAWLEELRRLQGVIQRYEGASTSATDLMTVSALLEDALRVAADLQYHLEEKERLARFEQAIGSLTREGRELLATILKGKMTAPDM